MPRGVEGWAEIWYNMGCMRLGVFAMCFVWGAAVFASPVIDNSPTRVQTTLKTGMQVKGVLRPKSVGEISTSHWSIDCAGTDREHVSYQAVKEYLPALGIRRMRVQAGWARCEKERGKYDFRWLDAIIFDAAKRGMEVWLETSYGNPIYVGGGGRGLAGGMPSSEEALKAWGAWVDALAVRYKGYVRDWCIWNEPDLFGANDIKVVIPFTLRTAEIIKARIPEARLAACALTWANPEYVEAFCKALKETGKAGMFTWIAYHHYSMNPDDGYEDQVEVARQIVKKWTPNLRLWQNESGTQSEWCPSGALCKYEWTELTQAKWDVRRYLADIGRGDDTGVFHACDLEYVNSGFHDGLVRYGLLKTAGQAEDYRVLKVKMAYYAVQNAVSVFNDDLEVARGAAVLEGLERAAVYGFKDKKTGTMVSVYWDASGVPSDKNETKEVHVRVAGKRFAAPVWVDVLTGQVCAIDEARVKEEKDATIYTVPCYDAPAFVCDEAILDYEKIQK